MVEYDRLEPLVEIRRTLISVEVRNGRLNPFGNVGDIAAIGVYLNLPAKLGQINHARSMHEPAGTQNDGIPTLALKEFPVWVVFLSGQDSA